MSFTKFHRFQQELTENQQKYHFTANWKKLTYQFAASTLVLFGSVLGVILVLIALFLNPFRKVIDTQTLVQIAVLGVILILFLLVTFVGALSYFIYLLVQVPFMKKLQKFSLTLEEGIVSVCNKTLTISEKLTIHITNGNRFRLAPLATAKLNFEPQSLSPFSELSKVERYLTYHEKRGLAEQLSLGLRIPLTDMLSSFEPGIYENQNFIKKSRFTKFEPSGSLKLEKFQNSHSIQLPLHKKKALLAELFLPLVVTILVFCISYYLFGFRTYTNAFFFFYISLLFAFVFVSSFRNTFKLTKEKILVTHDSISLTRRSIWGTRKIFSSQFSELKEIAIIPVDKSAQIVFRNDKLTSVTRVNSKEVIEEATMAIKNQLLRRV